VVARFRFRDRHRCAQCNAAFERVNLFRATAMIATFSALLGLLSWGILRALSGGTAAPPGPTLKKVPAPPPPVLR
jgi:hypothetical protein